jgi:CheY-like chemotaxis protein
MKTEPKTILIVDDNRNDVELTMAALSENSIVNAVDGVKALDFLYKHGKFSGYQNGNPSVILLNIIMPRMNGIEVLKHTFAQILNSG